MLGSIYRAAPPDARLKRERFGRRQKLFEARRRLCYSIRMPPLKAAEDPLETRRQRAYSDEGFWGKLARAGGAAGKFVLEKALTLYYCLKDPDTPVWARGVIIGALGYFILPLDAIPDLVPMAGYADDLGTLAVAFTTVLAHIKSSHSERAREQLRRFFGPKIKQVNSPQEELPPPL